MNFERAELDTRRVELVVERRGTQIELTLDDGSSRRDVFETTWSHDCLDADLAASGVRRAASCPADLSLVEAAEEMFGPLLPVPKKLRHRLAALGSCNDERTILWVRARDPELSRLPWEGLPQLARMRRTVVARALDKAPNARQLGDGLTLVVTVEGEPPLPLAEREGQELLADFNRANNPVERVAEPTLEEVAELAGRAPSIVHLVTNSLDDDGLKMQFAEGQGDYALHHADALLGAFSGFEQAALICLNVCDAGAEFGRKLCEVTGATVIGWWGQVSDEVAFGFAQHFYDRLCEGVAPAMAIESYAHQQRRLGSQHLLVSPVIWVPAGEVVHRELFSSAGPTGDEPDLHWSSDDGPVGDARGEGTAEMFVGSDEGLRGEFDAPAPTPLEVRIDLDAVASICPALVKSGQVPILRRLGLRTSAPVLNARLQVRCDVGHADSLWTETLDLRDRDTTVPVDRIRFPVLHDLITRSEDRRRVNLTVSVHGDGRVLAETTRSVLFLGPQEWLETRETRPYLASYVISQCNAVKEIISHAEPVLGILQERDDGQFTGYIRPTGEKRPSEVNLADMQIKALYQTMRQRLDLTYIAPPGGGVYLPKRAGADEDSADAVVETHVARVRMGQRVRFPDEVLRYGRGTCHDLSLLFAALAEHIGLYPVVVMISGHTLFGYWRDPAAYKTFWAGRSGQASRDARLEDQWTIRAKSTLLKLVEDEKIRLLETTMVTEPNVRFDDACSGRVMPVFERRLQALIDVRAARPWVEPIFRRQGD